MKTGLIVIGIILLVLGGIFFYLPLATTTATSEVSNEAQGIDRVSAVQAAATVPVQFSAGSMIIGLILTLLGFLIPDTKPKVVIEPKEFRTKEVYVKERI